jgi:hypothetical protein
MYGHRLQRLPCMYREHPEMLDGTPRDAIVSGTSGGFNVSARPPSRSVVAAPEGDWLVGG